MRKLLVTVVAFLAISAVYAAPVIVSGSLIREAGPELTVLELEGNPIVPMADGDTALHGIETGRWDRVEWSFTVPDEAAADRAVGLILRALEGSTVTWSACNDATDCAQRIEANCRKRGGVGSSTYLAPAGGKNGSCTGTCGDGSQVVVICATSR